MDIKILGPLSLTCEGQRLAVTSKRAGSVLALLALSPGEPVPVDQLADELWGEEPVGNARNAVQAIVSRLRRMLRPVSGRRGSEFIRTSRYGYVLDVAPEAVDAYRFRHLAGAGAGLVHPDPAAAIDELEQALGLWSGPALMNVRDGARCQAHALRLEEQRITAFERLTEAKLAVDGEPISVSELQEMATTYTERERLSELLMLALYRDGRQAEALEVFHGARRRLARSLALEPGPALHLTYQAILNQDVTLGRPRPAMSHSGRTC